MMMMMTKWDKSLKLLHIILHWNALQGVLISVLKPRVTFPPVYSCMKLLAATWRHRVSNHNMQAQLGATDAHINKINRRRGFGNGSRKEESWWPAHDLAKFWPLNRVWSINRPKQPLNITAVQVTSMSNLKKTKNKQTVNLDAKRLSNETTTHCPCNQAQAV